MKYIESTLVPHEHVLCAGRLHWIIYASPVLVIIFGYLLFIFGLANGGAAAFYGAALFILGAASLIAAWVKRVTTEIAVTTRRFAVKRGLVDRRVMEIGAGQLESVAIQQSIVGRLFDYGTLIVSGTGSHLDPVEIVAEPLALRQALDTLYRPH